MRIYLYFSMGNHCWARGSLLPASNLHFVEHLIDFDVIESNQTRDVVSSMCLSLSCLLSLSFFLQTTEWQWNPLKSIITKYYSGISKWKVKFHFHVYAEACVKYEWNLLPFLAIIGWDDALIFLLTCSWTFRISVYQTCFICTQYWHKVSRLYPDSFVRFKYVWLHRLLQAILRKRIP